jgi:hypothetical protein
MRVTPLLAFLLIATTARAEPVEERGERVPYSIRQRHRPRLEHDWVRLASPTPTRFGTSYIIVGRDAGWFRTLRIEVTAGRVHLRRIRILSPDGTRNTMYVDRWLDRHRPFVFVELGGLKRIDQLVVTTDRYPAGSYTIYGSSGAPQTVREVAMR